MSLQQLKSAPGSQMPLTLQLVSFEPYQNGIYGLYTKAVLSDGQTSEKVLVNAGNQNIQFQQSQCGLQLPFVLKSKQNGQYVNLSGYWKIDGQQQGQPQGRQEPSGYVPPHPSQTPGGSYAPDRNRPAMDPRQLSIEVQCAAKMANDMLINGKIESTQAEASTYFWAKVIANVKHHIEAGTRPQAPVQQAPPYNQQETQQQEFAPQVPEADIPEDQIPF